ncbi:MAG: hypothetical protein KBG73_09490 [Candidatus Promineofilum sp.]|jgi:hypothetical protein|nr:hypothetical protein [Promineifilum sp.]
MMGFLKKLFGGSDRPEQPTSKSTNNADPNGVYFYVQCDRCGAPVRLRADKQHDLLNEDGGYTWHKTIVDNRCFRPMPTVVTLNADFEMVSHEITGGRYITREEYEALVDEQRRAKEAAAKPAGDVDGNTHDSDA